MAGSGWSVGWVRWTWQSINPGSSQLPSRSTTVSSVAGEARGTTAAIRSPSMPMSARTNRSPSVSSTMAPVSQRTAPSLVDRSVDQSIGRSADDGPSGGARSPQSRAAAQGGHQQPGSGDPARRAHRPRTPHSRPCPVHVRAGDRPVLRSRTRTPMGRRPVAATNGMGSELEATARPMRWILPVAPLGISATNTICFGTLNGASCAPRKSRSSFSWQIRSR